LFEKQVPDNGEEITAPIRDLAVLSRPQTRVGLLHEIVDVVAVQGTDVPPQPAAYLTLVREDVAGYPAVAARIVQGDYSYRCADGQGGR